MKRYKSKLFPFRNGTGAESAINSDALNGLRGLASLHVLVFHVLFFSKGRINIIGSFEMPLFFLLSGYSLALNYGRKAYTTHTRCCCSSAVVENGNPNEEAVVFKSFNFYRNR